MINVSCSVERGQLKYNGLSWLVKVIITIIILVITIIIIIIIIIMIAFLGTARILWKDEEEEMTQRTFGHWLWLAPLV